MKIDKLKLTINLHIHIKLLLIQIDVYYNPHIQFAMIGVHHLIHEEFDQKNSFFQLCDENSMKI